MPQHSGKYKEQLTPTLTANFNLQVADALQSEAARCGMYRMPDNAMTLRHTAFN